MALLNKFMENAYFGKTMICLERSLEFLGVRFAEMTLVQRMSRCRKQPGGSVVGDVSLLCQGRAVGTKRKSVFRKCVANGIER